MDLNRMIPKAGSAIVTVTVFLFAIFEIINVHVGSFFVCLILPIGFIMMTAGLHSECESDRKVAANIGMVFAAVYCTLIMLVYFAQLTTVNNEQLTESTSVGFSPTSARFVRSMSGGRQASCRATPPLPPLRGPSFDVVYSTLRHF